MFTQDLNLVIDIIESNDKQKALPILAKILKSDPHNEKAWSYLYFCLDDKNRQLECLKRILEINPKNEKARNLLIKFDQSDDEANISKQHKTRITPINSDENQITDDTPKIRNHIETPISVLPNLALENINQVVNEQKARSKKNEGAILKNSSAPKKQEGGDKSKKTKKTNEKKKIQQHENNFFYGFREGVNQSSRLETGVFGKTTVVDGLKISPYEGPPCLRRKNTLSDEDCESCEYFSPRDCLLRFDNYLFEDLNRFVTIREEREAEQLKRSQIVSEIIHNELVVHGRPLHYSMISKIIIGRYPKLHLTEKSIRKFMEWHPELFERIEEGIYRAK